MGGASANSDGYSGLVPTPKAGQQNLFLRGDGSWAEASTDFNENVFSKVSGKVSLLNFEQANPNSILIKGSAGKLNWTTKEDFLSEVKGSIQTLQEMMSTFNGGVRRTIVDSLDKIDVNAENAENFIYMVSKAEEDRKDSNFYDEYMVVNGSIEKIGAGLSGNLTEDYVTSAAFNTQVGRIYSEMSKYTPLTTYES
jgi:hypothetical protein